MTTRKDPETGETISARPPSRQRMAVAGAFTIFEDVVYLSLGVLLAVTALVSLANGATALWENIRGGAARIEIVNVLDRILLVLMIVELLYTVKVSFREHALIPEPFLIVSLIAATRRILIVTAQFSALLEQPSEAAFRNAMLELALLTGMVVALVASLLMLRKRAATPMPNG
jgi:uncharacterized membrane protein (DUF373 family)